MLFKVIYHQRKPSKTSETFNRGWAAILISETSSVVSTARSVTSVLFDSLHFFFFFGVRITGQIYHFTLK